MSRWSAASIHLMISIVIAGTALAWMLIWPYPWTFFNAAGGSTLVTVLAAVDITIGPLLTLVIFRIGKPGLKFDLAVIGTLQILALIYGLSVIVAARPVFLIYVVDRFQLVQANDLPDEALSEAKYPQFRTRSWTGPKLAFAMQPTDPDEQLESLMSALAGADLDKFPKYYEPLDSHLPEIIGRASDCTALVNLKPQYKDTIHAASRRLGYDQNAILCIPVQTPQFRFLTALLNPSTGELMEILDIDPWPNSP